MQLISCPIRGGLSCKGGGGGGGVKSSLEEGDNLVVFHYISASESGLVKGVVL